MQRISLNGVWEFQWDSKNEKGHPSEWRSAQVPGDVHLDLVTNNLIPEPLNGFNTQNLGEIENRIWTYRKTFTVSGAEMKTGARLVFDGLDCIADIYLNDLHLGRTENAFVKHVFAVGSHLKEGENELLVKITNGLEFAAEKDLKKYTGKDSGNEAERRIWLRKAQFSFGWDWAPRLITCGIWRDVQLQFSDSGFADNFQIKPKLRNKYKEALVSYNFSYNSNIPSRNEKAVFRIKQGGETVIEKELEIKEGINKGAIVLQDPLLWWPAGYGRQPLYHAEIVMKASREILAESIFGIREVKLSEKNIKEGGRTFEFIVNGKKIYCQGSNWVPADSIIARVPDKKINTLLEEAARCNFNMLRVWGGGIYESDYFYKRCDELGLMVWQDFMYACALYPDDDKDFYLNCKSEAESVIKDLGNHPCIVVWCGNNEIHDGYEDVYCMQGIDGFYGGKIWDELLPSLLKKHLPGALYRPASPYGGKYHRSDLEGDAHCLMMGLTLGDSTDIRIGVNCSGRMNTEYYSWNSPPPLSSMKKYLPEEELHFDSAAYRHHANTMYIPREKEVAKRYISAKPEAFPFELYVGAMQRLHGQHMKMITDSFRRHMEINSGAMFWMYNDSWPTSGWTTHDYYCMRKAMFYYMKRSFAPVSLSIQQDYSSLSIWASNISNEDIDAVVEYGRRGFTDGKYQYCQKKKIHLKAGTSMKTGFFNTSLSWPWAALDSFGYASLSDMKNDILSSDSYFFSSYKGLSGEDFSFGPEYWAHRSLKKPLIKVREISKREFEITADVPAFSVHLDADDCLPDDNFFDIMPGERKIITLDNEFCGAEMKTSSLNDIIIYQRERRNQDGKMKLFG